jgi:hypothetical protein
MSYRFVDSFQALDALICEISASSWFYYKENSHKKLKYF